MYAGQSVFSAPTIYSAVTVQNKVCVYAKPLMLDFELHIHRSSMTWFVLIANRWSGSSSGTANDILRRATSNQDRFCYD